MKKLLLCLPFVIAGSGLPACAQDARAPAKTLNCTSTPSGNTETGEDPQEQRLREAGARSDAIRAGDDDQRRWASIRLNSDSTKPERLTMPVVKAAGLDMRLDPKLGRDCKSDYVLKNRSQDQDCALENTPLPAAKVS